MERAGPWGSGKSPPSPMLSTGGGGRLAGTPVPGTHHQLDGARPGVSCQEGVTLKQDECRTSREEKEEVMV